MHLQHRIGGAERDSPQRVAHLPARFSLALLEECNPDASNDRARLTPADPATERFSPSSSAQNLWKSDCSSGGGCGAPGRSRAATHCETTKTLIPSQNSPAAPPPLLPSAPFPPPRMYGPCHPPPLAQVQTPRISGEASACCPTPTPQVSAQMTLKSSLKSAHLKPTTFRGRHFREAVNDALRDVVRVSALAFVLALALDLDDLRVASDAEAWIGRGVPPEILAQTLTSGSADREGAAPAWA